MLADDRLGRTVVLIKLRRSDNSFDKCQVERSSSAFFHKEFSYVIVVPLGRGPRYCDDLSRAPQIDGVALLMLKQRRRFGLVV